MDVYSESCWFLAPFQRGQVPLFIEHIRQAVDATNKDPTALLVFSGGQTRPGVGPRSEAGSLLSLAQHLGLFAADTSDRAVTELHARDSLENLMFSYCRFKEITGDYPKRVSVYGFPFKKPRFVELHRLAIGVPLESFSYHGVVLDRIPNHNPVDEAYLQFKNDLYGCQPPLASKRIDRNPYRQSHGYSESCPDMRKHLNAC